MAPAAPETTSTPKETSINRVVLFAAAIAVGLLLMRPLLLYMLPLLQLQCRADSSRWRCSSKVLSYQHLLLQHLLQLRCTDT